MTDASTPRDRSHTEQRLKAAAIRVWAEHGFHGAPVSTIAARAGANVSLINRYFGGKQGLLLAIVQEMIDDKQAGDIDYSPQATLYDEIVEYLRFRYREDQRLKDLLRIVISEMATNREFKQQALLSLTYAADENFRERLKTLQDKALVAASADLESLFRQVALFSFSANFIEGIILELPSAVTAGIFETFARAIAAHYAP